MARSAKILLDGPTVQAARGRLAVEAQGSVVLRGQSTPVQIFGLRGETGMSAWSLHRPTHLGPLVGRETEVDRLRAVLDDAASGRGGIAVVVGEAGVGKTRLLAAMEGEARSAGFAWTWTENVSYGRAEPYRFARLFAQAAADEHGVDSGTLTRRLLFTDDLSPDDIQRYGGAIAAIARDAVFSGWEAESDHMPSDPLEVTGTLLEVATRYIERLMTTAGPRVVVIDDHWLDPSSIGMVELLADTTTRHPLVVLAGSRTGPLPAWAERSGVRRVDLGACRRRDRAAGHPRRPGRPGCGRRPAHPRADRRQPAVRQRDRARLPRGRHARMAGRTHRAGRVDRPQDADHPSRRPRRAHRCPRSDARLALGSPRSSASASTRRPSPWLLGTDPLSGAALDHLAASALIAPTEDGDWRFAHPLIHDAAYAGLLASRRRISTRGWRTSSRLGPGPCRSRRWPSIGPLPATRIPLPLLREAAMSALALGAAEAASFLRRAAELAEPTDPDAARRDRAMADAAIRAAAAARDANRP